MAMDLGAATDQLILMLYGTGIRNARAVTVTMAASTPPSSASPRRASTPDSIR